MRFRQIEAFQAVMTAGSITQGAAALNIGQPAVSRLIADLETGLGFPLFQRISGRLVPTAEAIQFYAGVERAFTSLQDLGRLAGQIRGAYSSHLIVAAIPVLASMLMPPVVKAFLTANPAVSIEINIFDLVQMVNDIRARKADLALSMSFADVPGLQQESLFEARMVCALPAQHRLARKRRIALADFDQVEFISMIPSSPMIWGRIDQLFAAQNIQPKRVAATPHSQTAYGLVSAGVGVSILEPFSAPYWSKHGVVARPLSFDLRFSYSLFYSTDSPISALARRFVDDLKRYVLEKYETVVT
jgi:DNA-binding transcriptional LysR family regulator